MKDKIIFEAIKSMFEGLKRAEAKFKESPSYALGIMEGRTKVVMGDLANVLGKNID